MTIWHCEESESETAEVTHFLTARVLAGTRPSQPDPVCPARLIEHTSSDFPLGGSNPCWPQGRGESGLGAAAQMRLAWSGSALDVLPPPPGKSLRPLPSRRLAAPLTGLVPRFATALSASIIRLSDVSPSCAAMRPWPPRSLVLGPMHWPWLPPRLAGGVLCPPAELALLYHAIGPRLSGGEAGAYCRRCGRRGQRFRRGRRHGRVLPVPDLGALNLNATACQREGYLRSHKKRNAMQTQHGETLGFKLAIPHNIQLYAVRLQTTNTKWWAAVEDRKCVCVRTRHARKNAFDVSGPPGPWPNIQARIHFAWPKPDSVRAV